MLVMKGLPAEQGGEIAMNAPMENAAKEILFGNAAQRLRCLTVLDMGSILPQPIFFDIPELGGIRRPPIHCPYGPVPACG
jgi:hypothetical protein